VRVKFPLYIAMRNKRAMASPKRRMNETAGRRRDADLLGARCFR
jgi:hypothetical protein